MPAPCCSGRGGRLAHRSRSSLHLALRREKPWPKELFLRICQNSASWGDLRLPACVLTAGQSGSISVTWNGARRCADALPGAAHLPPPRPPQASAPRLAAASPPGPRGAASRRRAVCLPPAARTERDRVAAALQAAPASCQGPAVPSPSLEPFVSME